MTVGEKNFRIGSENTSCKEEIVSLGKQHDKAIEEKSIAEDELIVRSREIEKKLLTILGRWMNWSRRCRGSR